MSKKENMEDPINGYVVNQDTYPVGKDIDGNPLTSKDIQEVLLKIILELDRVCCKNNIPYALAYGSALGLYNYHGFIPWDDDADIAVDFFDIPRLIDALKRDLSKEFYFDSYESDKRYNVLIPTIKLRMKNTYIKERNCYTLPNRCKQGDGLFIDIVAFMGVPENYHKHLNAIAYTQWKVALYVFLDSFLRIHPYHLKKRIKNHESKIANKYKDSNKVSQSVIIPFQNWGRDLKKLAYPREMIYPFKEYDFCGHKLYSFNDVEGFCRYVYGDKSLKKWDGNKYIDPFPIKKRKAGHARKISLKRDK